MSVLLSLSFLYGCGTDLCMKDIQGEWVVVSQTVLNDECDLASHWEPYLSQPYTFRGAQQNAILGPVECNFEDPQSSRFYCNMPFSMVYGRSWLNSVTQLDEYVNASDLSCNEMNMAMETEVSIDTGGNSFTNGASNGLIVSDSEIVVQFYGSICGTCYSDVQWKLRPAFNE